MQKVGKMRAFGTTLQSPHLTEDFTISIRSSPDCCVQFRRTKTVPVQRNKVVRIKGREWYERGSVC